MLDAYLTAMCCRLSQVVFVYLYSQQNPENVDYFCTQLTVSQNSLQIKQKSKDNRVCCLFFLWQSLEI